MDIVPAVATQVDAIRFVVTVRGSRAKLAGRRGDLTAPSAPGEFGPPLIERSLGKAVPGAVPSSPKGRLADRAAPTASGGRRLRGRCGRPLPYLGGEVRSAGFWPVPSRM